MVELKAGQGLMRPGSPVTHAHYPVNAIVSLGLPAMGKDQCFEVALVGSEGMIGLPLLLGGAASTLRATVVRTGGALRIPAAALHVHLAASEPARLRMQRYVLVSVGQLAQATLCTRYHRLDQRLARWLLMTYDRAPRGTLQATHEFLAATLGVRRAGVTRAAAGLQQLQLIAYHRGLVTVLDRRGLQAAACDCYAADCAAYARGMRAA